MQRAFTRMGIAVALSLLINANIGYAQEPTSNESKMKRVAGSFKDSLDGALDLSDWIIHYNGFIPVPAIITESALGGFGGALAPVFIKQNAPRVIDGKVYPIAPDITVAFGGYTLNNTWAVGAARIATIPQWGLKYKVGGAYANVNMDYYKTMTLPIEGEVEKEFGINIRTVPFFLYLGKMFRNPQWTVGLQYTFANSKLKLRTGDGTLVDSLIGAKDYNSRIASLSVIGDFDSRDNTFTPNKGFKVSATGMINSPTIGSDYEYQLVEPAFYGYLPVTPKWVCALRLDMQQVFGGIPFYVKPYLDMRGVPTMRYQGKTTMLVENEHRFDVYKRWSLIAVGGLGKAFDDYSKFSDATLVYNYGGGFRYLLARKLKLRMGVDVAKSNHDWGYYLVFGSAWVRQ